jgi:DNA-binding response OmpR family regulator
MRLLCVEDEAPLREDIVEYLRMHSYEVDEAESGEEAIDCLNQKHYDLVLCDIKMPRMDGYELLRQVRGENHLATTPFLFLSALNERDDKIRAHENGCDGYLTKPIDFSVLDATLKSHIDRQRARDFLHATALEASQKHMMAVLDDALSGPVAEAALVVQHLRDTLPTLTPSALDVQLANVQDKVNGHANELHAFHSALMMQTRHTPILSEMMQTEDLVREAVAECHYRCPSAPIVYEASSAPALAVHGDMRMLTRALAGLFAGLPLPYASSALVHWRREDADCVLTVCDHPDMAHEQDFTLIDDTTNLAALSQVTRHRLVALSYAMQVAHAHHGRLELLLWPEDLLAVRFVLPQ